ncbi:unnamed protein product [Trifolium pratense]|uniref:Uncharacterized protein n=1 Tax=Trifolium pratense TaxID=57577 RepID=A0ACB0M3N4_TRIPR|nr:unnamed protein product [Trifolium pratense]
MRSFFPYMQIGWLSCCSSLWNQHQGGRCEKKRRRRNLIEKERKFMKRRTNLVEKLRVRMNKSVLEEEDQDCCYPQYSERKVSKAERIKAI